MRPWTHVRKVLCIRPDNMGDLLMSAPAIAALKQTFGCHIAVLTSTAAKGIAARIPAIDDVIIWDVPWVKGTATTLEGFNDMIKEIRRRGFDGAVIFTAFSQNPLPSAMVATLAGIPNRAAYCRENPYHLLSHWIPEKEPYDLLRHQVERDLDLVRSIGAQVTDDDIVLAMPTNVEEILRRKMTMAGIDLSKLWLIMHPGVSEIKRAYDTWQWIEAGRRITIELGYQVVITGSGSETQLTKKIRDGIGRDACALGGLLSLDELIVLICRAPLLISVNTGIVHIAAAVRTKVVVLYALTNPQHAPWKAVGKILPFPVGDELKSRNEVLRHVDRKYFQCPIPRVTPEDIVNAARETLVDKVDRPVDELVLPLSNEPRYAKDLEFPRSVEFPEDGQRRNKGGSE